MPQASPAAPRPAVSRAAAAWALVAGICFFLFSDPFLSPPDCALYWSWAQSLFRDLDLDFWNDYAGFEVPLRYVYLTGAGRISNDWPIGAGLALGPVVLLGKTIAHAWTILFCVGAMALWARSEKGLARGWGLGAMIAGTPVLFYLSFGPFFSHAASFAATTAFLVAWSRTRGNRTRDEWILLGLLLGLATVVRPQNALLAIVFLAELPARFPPRFLFFAAAAALLAFAPQIVAWQFLYGSPLALPKVDEMRWLSPALSETLLSDYHGVLPWTPIYVPALAGLCLLWSKDARLAAGLLLMLAVQLYINASNEVWWAGGSFGNRRLMDGAIVVAWGIAALATVEGKPARWAARAAIVACCAWTTWLLLAERAGALPLSRHVPFASDAFAAALRAPLADPGALWRGLARWEPTPSLVAARAAGAVIVAASVALAPLAAARLRRVHAPRAILGVGAWCAAMLALCIIAGARTPPFDGPPEIADRLGTTPGVLWDNHTELAYYLQTRGDFAGMEEAARKAIAVEPGHPTGWWYLAVALLQQERLASGLDALREVLRLDPAHGNGRRLWEDLTGQPPPSPLADSATPGAQSPASPTHGSPP